MFDVHRPMMCVTCDIIAGCSALYRTSCVRAVSQNNTLPTNTRSCHPLKSIAKDPQGGSNGASGCQDPTGRCLSI